MEPVTRGKGLIGNRALTCTKHCRTQVDSRLLGNTVRTSHWTQLLLSLKKNSSILWRQNEMKIIDICCGKVLKNDLVQPSHFLDKLWWKITLNYGNPNTEVSAMCWVLVHGLDSVKRLVLNTYETCLFMIHISLLSL